jgi:Pyridoxamine 5'-phosphate oxidase
MKTAWCSAPTQGPSSGSILSPVVFEVDHLDRKTRSAWSVVIHGSAHHVNDHDQPALRQRVAALTVLPWLPISPRRRLGGSSDTGTCGGGLVGVAAGGEPRLGEVDDDVLASWFDHIEPVAAQRHLGHRRATPATAGGR